MQQTADQGISAGSKEQTLDSWKASPANVQPLHCNFCQCNKFRLSSRTTTATHVGENRVNSERRATRNEEKNLALTEISSAAQGEQHGCNGN
jgi:hypothetical protein